MSTPLRRSVPNRSIPARRRLLRGLGLAVLALAAVLGAGAAAQAQVPSKPAPQRIGIIGTGQIGGALARLWVAAGHEVLISSRHPAQLESLAAELGPKARVGTPREAAQWGEVVLISVPYGALPQVGRDYAKELAGKVVLDTGNPYPQRDGAMAEEARRRGTGAASKAYLPGLRLVRAFNAIFAQDLVSGASRPGARIAIPLAGDDTQALAVAERLVVDAGFDPVVVGGLDSARRFDVDTPVYTVVLTARELRARLGLAHPE